MKLLIGVLITSALVTGCDDKAKREAQAKLDRQFEEAGGIHRDKDGRPYDRSGKYIDGRGGKVEGPIKNKLGRYEPPPVTDVDRGQAAKLEGKEDEARKLFASACAAKVPDGCAQLALMDVDKDRKGVEAKLKALCDANDGDGCAGLALSYETSLNPRHEADEITTLYDKGCTLKSWNACNALGMVYFSGRSGVTKDPAKAVAALKRGCDMGDQYSCDQMGMVGGR